VWAKNPLTLTFNAFGEPSTSYVIVIIETNYGDVVTELSYPIIIWLVKVPIDSIMKAIFDAAAHPPDWKFAGVFIDKAQGNDRVRDLTIKYRLSTDAPGSETAVFRKVIEGGIANLRQELSGEINEYSTFSGGTFFPKNVRFLTHLPQGRVIDADMVAWVPYYSYQNIRPTALYYVQYVDGTSTYISKIFDHRTNYTDTFWQIPIGVKQVALDPTDKGIRKMTLLIVGGGDGEIDLGQYWLSYNYLARYNWVDIGFQNSLGGWDSYRFDTSIKLSSDVERKEHETILSGISRTGTNNYYDSELRIKWQCSTGYISAAEMVALNDILNSKDIRVFFEGNWLPVKCTTKTLQWKDTANNLYNELFEFESAGSFETLPQQMIQFFDKAPELR
jgi:hypothetical protein